jgi:hypothetical protein
LRTQKDADGRIISLSHHVLPVPAHVGVELADVLVIELFEIQLDQHVALEEAMVEDEVYEVVGVVEQNPLLACFETETVPQLQQKILESVQQLVFQMRLAHDRLRLELK